MDDLSLLSSITFISYHNIPPTPTPHIPSTTGDLLLFLTFSPFFPLLPSPFLLFPPRPSSFLFLPLPSPSFLPLVPSSPLFFPFVPFLPSSFPCLSPLLSLVYPLQIAKRELLHWHPSTPTLQVPEWQNIPYSFLFTSSSGLCFHSFFPAVFFMFIFAIPSFAPFSDCLTRHECIASHRFFYFLLLELMIPR